MKIVQIIFALSLLSSYLLSETRYCIVLESMTTFDKNNPSLTVRNIVKEFDKVRIEKHSKYFAFKVGDYEGVSKASDDLQKLKKKYRDAYVSNCRYNPSVIVYPLKIEEEKAPTKEIVIVPKNNTKNKECFAPMYLELEKENNKTVVINKGDYNLSSYPKIGTSVKK